MVQKQKIAKRIGITPSYLSMILMGRVKTVGFKTARKIGKYLQDPNWVQYVDMPYKRRAKLIMDMAENL